MRSNDKQNHHDEITFNSLKQSAGPLTLNKQLFNQQWGKLGEPLLTISISEILHQHFGGSGASIITAFSKHLVTIPDISNHQVLSREEVILGLGESQRLSLNCSSNCIIQFEFNKLRLIYSSKIYSLERPKKEKHLGGHNAL